MAATSATSRTWPCTPNPTAVPNVTKCGKRPKL
jgi:hypothetical protein